MEFRVLGPVEVWHRGSVVPVPPKQRALLAELLIHANEVVSTDRLLEEVWGEAQPEGGVKTLRFHISKLRDALDPDRAPGEEGAVATRAPGYVLRADPEVIDAARFELLVDDARQALVEDPVAAAGLLEEALALWRGPPFADFAYAEFAQSEIRRLEELRLGAVEEQLEALLALGRHQEVVGELEALAEEHPLRERLWGLLMVAMYRSGRQAEALRAYQQARQLLGEELGIEPSPDLRRLEERILLQDHELLEAGPLRAAAGRVRGYELRGVIGEGAFGVTYRAYQPAVGREVAVKAIRPEFVNQPGFVRRFEAEAQLVAQLEHPHIVPLFDFWREPDGAYLVMPYLRGGSLRGARDAGAWEPARVASMLEQIGAALSYAHRRGVVHRDVHPGNVLLDEDGNAYLADFGIAAQVDEETPPSVPSPAYLSPEQRIGEQATPRSDVFGLGVVARHVMAEPTPAAAAPHASPDEPSPRLPPVLYEVLAKAAAERPEDRYPSVDEFVADFCKAVAPTPGVVWREEAELRNPYKGLRAFHETDAADFFGRETLINELLDALARHRLVGVVGPSGSGKSSLVRAGLVPALRSGRLAGSADWLIADMFPGARPFEELETGLLGVAVQHVAGLAEKTREAPETLPGSLGELLPADAELLLIVDQFEELFTLTSDESTRRAFMDGLVAMATDPSCRVRVIVTLRADFYHRPLLYQQFGELVAASLVSVTPPSDVGLAQAVTRPARSVGVDLEPGLEAVIVGDVSNQPGGLPLMEYALTELFERRDDHDLTAAAYRDSGGVLGALGRRAEELYAQLDQSQRDAARQLFLRLVTVDEQTADTRRRVTRQELAGLDIDPAALDEVVARYGDHRLLSFDRDPDTRDPTIEVAHEALLREWERLWSWIKERRDALLLYRRFTAARDEWTAANDDPGYLLTGSRLDQFEGWAAETDLSLTADERSYLFESRSNADREQARRTNRRRLVMSGFAAAAVIALVLAGLAQWQSSLRRDEARVNRARELAGAAVLNLDVDPELSVRLALEGIAATDEPQLEAVEALHRALAMSRTKFQLVWDEESPPEGGLVAAVTADGMLAISDGATVRLHGVDDGRLVGERRFDDAAVGSGNPGGPGAIAANPVTGQLATVDSDGMLRVWDPDDAGVAWSTGLDQALVGGLEFSPDGEWLAALGQQTSLWNAATGGLVWTIPQEGEGFHSFDSAGDRLALGIWGENLDPGEVVVLDRATGSELERIEETANVAGGAFSPDGARIYVGLSDGTVVIYDAETLQVDDSLAAHESTVWSIRFSPDGLLMATESSTEVKIWDVVMSDELLTLRGGGDMYLLDFSPDGSSVFTTGSAPGSLRAWDIKPQGPGEAFSAHPSGMLLGIDVSPDGRTVVIHSTGGDFELGGATVWDLDAGREQYSIPGLVGDVFQGIAFSPDGSRFAVQMWDETEGQPGPISLWETDSGSLLWTMEGSAGFYRHALAFSADGRMLASGGTDDLGREDSSTASVYDVDTGRLLLRLEHPDLHVSALGFSPDGRLLATATCEVTRGFFSLWDWAREELLVQVPDRGCQTDLSFSPTGDRVAVAGWELDSSVWDVATRAEAYTLSEKVFSIDFSPDGNRLVTGGEDGTVRIWDASDGRELLTIAGPPSWVTAVEFLPDGLHVLAATVDGNIRVLTLDVDELVEIARGRGTRTLTETECLEYHFDPCPSFG